MDMHTIAGDYMDERGYLEGRSRLTLRRTRDCWEVEDDCGHWLPCRLTDEVVLVAAAASDEPHLDFGWRYLPDAGEAERIGLQRAGSLAGGA